MPRREEPLELLGGQLGVRAHVVAEPPALEAPQRPDDPDGRHPEGVGRSGIGRRIEPRQDPRMGSPTHGDPDRQARPPQARDGRSEGRIERPTCDHPVAGVDEAPQAGRPADGIDAVRLRDVVAVPVAHVVEVPRLGRPTVIGRPPDDVAHDLDVGRRAPQPGPLGAERARPIQVDAAGPGGCIRRRDGSERRCAGAEQDNGGDGGKEPAAQARRGRSARHHLIVARSGRSRHRGRSPMHLGCPSRRRPETRRARTEDRRRPRRDQSTPTPVSVITSGPEIRSASGPATRIGRRLVALTIEARTPKTRPRTPAAMFSKSAVWADTVVAA